MALHRLEPQTADRGTNSQNPEPYRPNPWQRREISCPVEGMEPRRMDCIYQDPRGIWSGHRPAENKQAQSSSVPFHHTGGWVSTSIKWTKGKNLRRYIDGKTSRLLLFCMQSSHTPKEAKRGQSERITPLPAFLGRTTSGC